ncbi:fatty acid desaturase [Aquabacterium sp.]|uniref:fatty acid desaturase n=1 Tax=Aquabacterium sp. TaxID=1872578 RepID=UPI0024897544|nr:fatty acid desaturase [Aquabacterium sp.]MDI1259516.1 fatty acid desaturase [Aquabacterium sp.]
MTTVLPTASSLPISDLKRTQLIRQQVSALGDMARQRHPWLAHQNAIGLSIQLAAIGGMVLCSWLYLSGQLPWWGAVPLIGMLASLTHEIEHDLIHLLYFKQRPWVQHALLLLGWLSRPSTVNPWMRRQMHFHHHKKSGHPSDFEERAITNGEAWGLKRLFMTLDNMLAIMLRPNTMRSVVRQYVEDAEQPASRAEWRAALFRKALSYMPLGHAFWAAWHAFVVFHLVDLVAAWMGQPIAWSPELRSAVSVLDAVTVCLIAPNILRNFCLHFISSNMHYYGDVEAGNVMQQTQVLNHPVFWPMQLFCFNFGSTHAIHHFVVGQPFYLRQMIASEAHEVLRSNGVRFNDLGTFRRANRLQAAV